MELPKVIKNVGFEFSWSEPKVWALNISTEKMAINELVWHLEVPFWSSGKESYNLTPKEVLQNPKLHDAEFKRISDSNTSYPLDIMFWKNRWLLLDGLHRLAKLFNENKTEVNVRIVPHNKIPEILTSPGQANQSWINPKAKIRESPIAGKGLFAKEDFMVGEVVVVWSGLYTNATEAEKARKAGKLVTQWDEDLYSVEDRGDDSGYFVNHSCDSHLWMEDAYTLITRKPIMAGEEITADYALWEAEDYVSTWKCKCGLPDCRKTITGKDWLLKSVHSRYLHHFSPLINKRI
ncbi:MAG: SET domain-containing protein-lysine N-methyltransferase [Patescibacteria group bacterium]|jgi:hypothetical protein